MVLAAGSGFLGVIAAGGGPAIGGSATASVATVDACTLLASASYSAGSECMYDAYVEAFENGELAALQSAVYAKMPSSTALGAVCHDSGHEAGRDAVESVKQAAGLVQRVGTLDDACSNAFLHGVLDKVASLKADKAGYEAVVAACQGTTGAILNSCSDGLGHSLWLRDLGLPFAISVCERFAERESGRCVGGIVMQMLRPNAFTGEDPLFGRDSTPQEWAKVCNDIQALTANQEMVRSCWYEVGSAALIPVDYLLQEIGVRLEEMLPSDVRALNTAWAAGIAKCEEFGDRAEDCERRIAEAVSWRVGDNQAWMEATCPVLGEKWRAYCLKARSMLKPGQRP